MLKSVVFAAFLTCGAISAYAQTQTTPAQPSSPAPTATPADRTVSTGDFNAKGHMAASGLIGTKVRNANKESIGKIDDIYLGMFGVLIGLAIAFDTPWPLVTLVPFALVIRYGVVAREEAYLERKFGQAYRDYKKRVRRWL